MNRAAVVAMVYAAGAAGAYLIGGWIGPLVFLGAILAIGSILSLILTLLQRPPRAMPFHRRFIANFGKALRAILFTLP